MSFSPGTTANEAGDGNTQYSVCKGYLGPTLGAVQDIEIAKSSVAGSIYLAYFDGYVALPQAGQQPAFQDAYLFLYDGDPTDPNAIILVAGISSVGFFGQFGYRTPLYKCKNKKLVLRVSPNGPPAPGTQTVFNFVGLNQSEQ